MRRAVPIAIAISTLLAVATTTSRTARTQEAPDRPPNVVVILSDDQGWNDVGWHGSEVRTPNLDRLAAEGVRLEQHYVYATCSPTRVALLSGRYPSRYGVLAPLAATTEFKADAAHLPHGLRALGYRTHIVGKWHIGETPEHLPRRYGFDTSYGYLRGQIDPYTHRYKHGDHVTWHRNDAFVEERGHVTDLITEEAVRVIEQAGDRPFFLYVAHHSPHAPLNEPPGWIAPYDDVFDDVWRRHYAAAVTHMDEGIGQVVSALDRTGLRQHTLIVFSSDNGGQRRWNAPPSEYNGRYAPHTTLGDNRPLRGWKTELYEGGIRVPALMNWPGVLGAGGEVTSPTHVCDLAPTLLRLAGGTVDPGWTLEGADLWPLVNGRDTAPAPRTLYWRTPSHRAIRQGDWKLIVDRNDAAELFDLRADPHEQHERSAQHPERVRDLRRLLEQHTAEDLSTPPS